MTKEPLKGIIFLERSYKESYALIFGGFPMTKKLISFILCSLFAISAILTGCSGNTVSTESDNEDPTVTQTTDRKPMTLSLWLPTDASTTPEAIKQVEAALNEITELKFSTHLELHAVSDAEYQDAIDAKIDSIADVEQRAKRESESLKQLEIELAEKCIKLEEYVEPEPETEVESESEEEIETIIDEQGDTVSVYPEVREDQLDIFLIRGYDNYIRYINEDLVEMLDGELNGNSRLLRTYIYPSFLECVNQSGIYAIPNNHVIGKYQFLLINKELAEKYDYDESEFDSFENCKDFIVDIGDMKLDGVVPLLGPVEPGNMIYFSSDGKWSLIGDRIEANYTYKFDFDFDELVNTLEYPFVNGVIKTMKELEKYGYVGNGTIKDGEKFAVGVVEGDFTLKKKYEDDYYIHIHAVPYADEDDIFASMFAVSPYTKNLARSMEIITYLNTNTTFRTILQYGVQGVHWDTDPNDNECIKALSSDYKMNITDTGNIFMTYPDYGLPMSYWKGAMQQNLDSATSPYIGFEYITDANKDKYDELAVLSAQVKAKIDAMTFDNLSKELGALRISLVKNSLINDMLNEKESEMEDSFASMLKMYSKSK